MALKKIGGTIAAIFCMTSALCGLEAFAEEWSQNLDAKPIILPCGLKFGEVYEGTVNQVRTNYLNGIASRCYEAVITNSWYGFDEIKITLQMTCPEIQSNCHSPNDENLYEPRSHDEPSFRVRL